jgi:probable H4MPT-linked C1 transfer pathway protein
VPRGAGLLIDLGSTTADIVPLVGGGVAAAGRTDLERLACRELVYTGVERTPLFGLLAECRLRGATYPTAPEWFATAADAYVLLGEVPEDPHNRHTADGRPLTRAAAHARVARIVCGDSTLITLEEARQIASDFRAAQQRTLESGIRAVAARLPEPPAVAAIGGQGEFLVRQVLQRLAWDCRIVSLSEAWGPAASRCGPAYALASLGTMADAW